MTVKNTSGSTAIISFEYSMEGASFKIDGAATTTTSGTISRSLANNGTVVLVATNAAEAGASSKVTAQNFQLIIDAPRSITINASEGGTITVNGNTVSSTTTVTANYSTGISLSAAASTGYAFLYWVDSNNNILSSEASFTFKPTSDATIHAVFVSNSSTQAYFQVGSKYYTDLSEAVAYAQSNSKPKITLVSDGVLPEGNYTIPSGITLLIPFDAAQTVYTSVPTVLYNSYTTPTAYKTLTMASDASITVQSGGAICLGGNLSSKGQLGGYNGTPTGPDGRIYMLSGSSITLNSGANLYCWGYIYGSGEVEAKPGSTVYEAFQIKDWRGGSATLNVYDYVFIFNQYYVQNVEAALKVNEGASVKLYSSVNASSRAYPIGATLIGTGGMFQISSGYIVKDYNESKDQLDVAVYGNVSMNPLVISGVPMVGDVSTENYRLPLNNMNIDIRSGKITLAQDLEFLPGSEVTVARGAEFEVSSGKKVYLFDVDDWGNFTGSAKLYAVGYSVANGTAAIRTAANLKDARIDVNGKVTVEGSLFTSEHGADITSTEGFDNGDNGKFVFNTAPTASATIYECANNEDRTSVSFYAPKLHNGDDSYSATAGTGTSTWKYDKDGEHWYRYLVDFVYDGNTIARAYYCENNDTVTYDASWLANPSASVTSGSATAAVSGTDVNVTNVTADSVVTLNGTAAEFIPTFILNEKQYSIYQSYTGNTITNTVIIGEDTYYIVDQASSALAVGTAYAAPADASMGVTAANHNSIIWNMSGGSYTSGDPYRGIVPAGETAQGPVYIYGFYDGVIAYNSYTDKYYKTLIDAFADTPTDATATITLLADCGTFEEELGTQAYTCYKDNDITLDLNGHHAVGRIINKGTFTLELNGGSFEYVTGATAAAATYKGMAAIINSGKMTIQDSVGGGKITADAISNAAGSDGSAVIRNNAGGSLTVTGKDAEHLLKLSQTQKVNTNNYGIFNLGTITALTNVDISTENSTVLYNHNGGTINTLKDSELTITKPTTKNVYVVFNYGGTITIIDNCTITGNSGINNRNLRGSNTIAQGYNISKYGVIETITNSTVSVGQYAIYNGGTINTLSNSTFTAAPASAQVPWPSGTAALNGNVHCYTIVNSNLWWYDTAVWKRTDTTVKNGDTTMLQRRIDEYKTDDEFMPTIGTITNCTIEALNTSNSNSYGYFALQNLGVINTITGSTTITAKKHPDNAKTVYGYYALRNEGGGKIGNIASSVTVSAYNYALANIGARYSRTDTSYSTTYLVDGKLKSGGLATDYDYTYADVSYIGSTAATITATSQYAILNYSKIGSITGTVSANYNVIVNAGAANTTTGIEGTTANVRAIEHRYFEGNDSSTTANEYRRYFEYTRNTTDGCYIGTINATVTATGAGYQAITNQGYIGTITGTVNTPTGKATSGSTYYPLIFNGNQRQATLKQDENYYIETNGAGATKYLREYTYLAPTIDTISCTATNPQDYTIQNYGVINNLTGNISGKTITVANETGYYLTHKSIIFYSSTSRFAASKVSSEVSYEYTKEQATINSVNGATIKATNGATALRNYGHIGTIRGSTITSTGASTVINSNAGLTVTNYTSNRSDVLVGCVPNGTASCALRYDTTQTINENETCAIALIDLIGAGNTIRGTKNVIDNKGEITEIDSGSGTLTTITATGGTAVYNYQGSYDSRINNAAELTDSTGTLTNHYTYNYVPAEIGMIKNVYFQSTQNAIKNGEGNANYVPVRIGEIGDGAEFKSGNGYSAVYNYSSNAQIEKITGGIFTSGTGNAYGLYNGSTTYPILISGGHFKGAANNRANAIYEPDNTDRQTYPEGMSLSADTEDVTLHDGTTGSDYYYIWKVITVTFNANDGVGTMDQQTVGAGKEFTLNTNTFTRDGYEFSGWNTAADGSGTAYGDGAEITLNVDTTLYAQWTEVAVTTYTVTWKNYDGTVLETDENVEAGTIPSYNGPTPTKEATAEFTYTFAGWTPEVVAVTDDAVYTATFTERKRSYTVTWKNADGTALETDADVPYGTVPSYDGATPTKEATAEFTYTFAGWTREGDDTVYTAETLPAVTGDVTYTAHFRAVLRRYTVTVHHYLRGTTDSIAADVSSAQAYGTEYTAQAVSAFYAGFDGCDVNVSGTLPTVEVTGDTELTVYYTLTITITAASDGWTYDGSAHSNTAVTVTAGALRSGDELIASAGGSVTNVSDTAEGNNPVAAGYGVHRNGESAGYYLISTEAGTLTINPKAVTVTAVDNGKTYGETDPALTAEVTGLIGGDTVEYTLSRAEGEAVGEYAITASGAAAQGNYAVSFVNGTFTISPKAITVTANNANKTYGETDPAFTATVEGLLDDTSITYTLTREEGENAGEYAITVSGDSVQGNYSVVFIQGVFTISRASVTVTPDDETWTYHGSDDEPALTAIVTGLKNGDSANVITYTLTREPGTEAGRYTITASGDAIQGNYDVTFGTGVFTIVLQTYTIVWKNWDGFILETDEGVPYGTTPVYNGETPERPANAQYTYTFRGWAPSVTPAAANFTYTAIFNVEVNTYTVRWKNWNDDVLETDASVPYGNTPQYNGETPVKQGDAQYTYTFIGWNDETETYLTGQTLPPVHGDTVFTAVYSTDTNKYTVEWIVNGETVETDTNVPYGIMPEYNGATPEKEGNAQYSYRFTGWDPEVTVVTGNAVYTAVFEEILNTYTVTWIGHDGHVLETDEGVPYGTTPAYNGNTPQKPSTPQYSYSFAGWAPEVVPVTGNAEYTAVFTENTRTYTVTWKNWNGEVLAAVSGIPYGDMPVYSGPDPVRPADAQYTYVFTGWYPTMVSVTGDAVYTAQYGTIVNRYTISFIGYNNAEVASYTVDYGTAVSVPAAPEVEGHTFVEWKSGDTVYPTGSTVTAVEDLTIQAEYSVNTYTVTYKVNGIAVDYLTVRYGDPIPASSFVAPEGCRLGEWGEIPETMPAHDVTVEAEMTTTITYEANGGKGDAVDRTVLWMVEDVLENALFEREGFTFAGWNTEADGSGSAYGGGAAVTPAGPMTLYAQWSERTFTITWNNYDGSKLGETVTAYDTMPVYEGEDPEKPGNEQYTYSFTGWTPAIVPAHEDTTYTAVFSASVNTYEIRFVNYNGALLASYQVPYGEIPVYSGQIPEKPSTDEFSYSFAGWEPTVVSVTGDAEYRAVFMTATNTYTVTWYNWDGTELEKDEDVAYGTLPTYDGELPKRAADVQYTYEFAGWTPAVSAVTGNTAYTAVYSTTVNEYTVRFLDYNGEELAEYTLAYGTTPEYNGPAPERAATAQYTYSFAGWSPEISEVTGNVDYTAVYSSTVNTYTVTFVNEGGELLWDSVYEYGATPVYGGETPRKASTAQYSYTFTGWTPEITEVTGDTVYTAAYSETVNSYPITWYGWNGEVLATTMAEYGTLPAYDAPERPADAQYTYTFTGWTPEIAEVTGAAAYTATYLATVNTYTVTWVNWNGTVLKTDAGVPYGTLPAYTGETPVRPSDNENVYTFTGWTPKIAEVEGDVTYTAAYSAEDRFYDLYVTVNLTAPVTESRTFVFRALNENETVQLLFPITVRSGSQAATTCIHGMKYGTYTVTELTGWSWEYGLTDDSTASRTVVIHSASDSYTAVFGNRPHVFPWLRSEQTRLFD